MENTECNLLTHADYHAMDQIHYYVRGLLELPLIIFSMIVHIFCLVLLLTTKNLQKVLINRLIISNGFFNIFLLALMSVRVLDEAHGVQVKTSFYLFFHRRSFSKRSILSQWFFDRIKQKKKYLIFSHLQFSVYETDYLSQITVNCSKENELGVC
jgi:hypothetical protein